MLYVFCNKADQVDRSVTGLVAQQQCVGPLHTPVADVGVVALSYFDTVGEGDFGCSPGAAQIMMTMQTSDTQSLLIKLHCTGR